MIPPRPRLSNLLFGVAVLVLAIPEAQARRRRRPRERARPAAERPDALKDLGQPRVVVVHRQHITAFARTAAALKRVSPFPVTVVTLDPREPEADLREDVEEAKPRIVVALGPVAARICARGFGDAAVVFAYRSSPPETTIRRGGWLRHGARPRDVVRWLRKVRPRLRSLGVVLPSSQDPLVRVLKRGGRNLGVEIHLAFESRAGSPLRALLKLLRDRPDAIWLGQAVGPWSALQLQSAQRLQSTFRVPVVGLTTEHVRRGLALAIDSAPETVAKSIASFIRTHARRWLARPKPAVEEPKPRPRRRRRRRRRRRERRERKKAPPPRAPVEAAQLDQGRVPAERVSINVRRLRAIGLSPRPAIAAGAIQVQP